MADTDIRISATDRRLSVEGVYFLGWVNGVIPVSIDPSALIPSLSQIGGVSEYQLADGLATRQPLAARGVANGYASLDANGRVPTGQLPASAGGGTAASNATPQPLSITPSPGVSPDAARADHVHKLPTPADIGAAVVAHTHSIAAVVGLQISLDAKIPATSIGVVNGVAPLGSDNKVPNQFLPAGISQASLDAKADISYVTTQLLAKANVSDLATKVNATDTRLVNAVQPDFKASIEAITASYTAVAADANKIKRYDGISDIVVTLPAMTVGTVIRFIHANSGKITFAAGASQTLNSFGGLLSTAGKSANVIVTVDAVNSWNISGNLA